MCSTVGQALNSVKPTRFYRPELDSLRFIAFLAVFLHHILPNSAEFYLKLHALPMLAKTLAAFASGGAFGVDLFFLLSAYLITELLLREQKSTGQLNIKAFYLRRVLRIWPLYFLILAVASALPLFDSAESFGWQYKCGFLLLSGNWMCGVLGYPQSIAAPLWSVSIEEQFYLLWPAIVQKASVTALRVAAGVLLVIPLISRAWLLLGTPQHPALWCNTLCRLDPIALGILVALYFKGRSPNISGRVRLFLMLCGLTTLIVTAGMGDLANPSSHPIRNFFAYPAAALGCLALFAAAIGSPLRWLSSSLLTYLGKISYGLYAFHVFCIWLATHMLRSHSPLIAVSRMALALTLTIVIAGLSYRYLETPFLNLKSRFAIVPSRPA